MTEIFIKLIKKGRFVLVGALVMALTSIPFVSNAKVSQNLISIDAKDSIAGLSTEINLENADSFSNIEILVVKPSGNQVVLETISNAKGEADMTLSDYYTREAGIYTVAAKHSQKNESFSKETTFKVMPGQFSGTKSEITLSKSTAKKGETVEMKVKLFDQYGNPIKGHFVQATTGTKNIEIYSPDNVSDKSGEIKFYIKGENRGVAEITVIDTSLNKVLDSHPKIAILDGNDKFMENGGFSNTNTNVLLASESGPLDSFKIDGIADTTKSGTSKNVKVTALDADGFTVTDYTGTIRFSSTDKSATLPNDYSFLPEDQGEHTFSLTVKFVTTGIQTLTVTDLNQTNIIGETQTDVVSQGNNIGEEVVDVSPDFETVDFERKGDFTLISPAAGTYSSDKIQIQGEGDYGYNFIIYLNNEEAGRGEIDFDNSFTYTLENVDDGIYALRVDVVDLGEGEIGKEEILSVIETSDVEKIIIDTTPPELISFTSDPESGISAGQTLSFTLLSETGLQETSVLLNNEIYALTETNTSGKYQGEAVAPTDNGAYSIDLILADSLGNEVQYRDQMSITVGDNQNTNTESATTVDTQTVPKEVSGLTAIPGEEQITLSWDSLSDNTSEIAYYTIYYGPSAEALYASTDTFDASTTWFIPSLTPDQLYYIGISATDINGNEGPISSITSSVPLAKASSTVEPGNSIPFPEVEIAAISTTGTPSVTPDTGAATNLMIVLSTLMATIYLGVKKKKATVIQ